MLILYALGKIQRGDDRKLHFKQVDSDLRELLMEFGPPRKSYHPEQPYWRLQNDNLWEVEEAETLQRSMGKRDVSKTVLLKEDAKAGFKPEIQTTLLKDSYLIRQIASD